MKTITNVLNSGICVQKTASYPCLRADRSIKRAEYAVQYREARKDKLKNVFLSLFMAQASRTTIHGYRNSRHIVGTVEHNAKIGPKLHVLCSNGHDITDFIRLNWYHKGIIGDKEVFNALLFAYNAYTVQDMEGNKKYWLYPSKLMSIERDIPLYTVWYA
jgi:hypothetical protein